MNFQTRLILAAVLSLGVLIGHSYLFPPPKPDPTTESITDKQVVAEGDDAVDSEPAATENSADAPKGTAVDKPAATAKQPKVSHAIANEVLKLRLSNRSAGLLSGVELLDPQFRVDETKGFDFLKLQDGLASLQVSAAEGSELRMAKGRAEVVEKGAKIFATRRVGRELEVGERIELRNGYEALYTLTIRNLSNEEASVQPQIALRMGADLQASQYSIDRALCFLEGEGAEEADHSDVDEGPTSFKGAVRWAAVDSKYFVSALVPDGSSFQRCAVSSADMNSGLDRPGLVNRAVGAKLSLGAGEQTVLKFGLYFGPKSTELLADYETVKNAELEASIDWGWLGGIGKLLGRQMLDLMRFFHDLTGVWGVAIILLTVVVKLVTLPLTLRQMRSMKVMRDLKPEMNEINEKYKNDTMKRSQEMQALFARRGVNPMASCLPMIVQLPVWFALYAMLGMAVELYSVPFLWLEDLTRPDAFFILPVVMSGMMFLQMSMQPAAGDPQQQAVMKWAMPGIFLFMMLFLPSGLGVYIFANTALSVVQTFVQLRPDKRGEADAAEGTAKA